MNFLTSEGIKRGCMVLIEPGAQIIVPAGKPVFEEVGPTRIEREIIGDRVRCTMMTNIRCNAVAFEGFHLIKFNDAEGE